MMYSKIKIPLIFLFIIVLSIACGSKSPTQSNTQGIYEISWVIQPAGTLFTPGDCTVLRTYVSFEWAVTNTNNVGATITSYTYQLLGADSSVVWSVTENVLWSFPANSYNKTVATTPFICYHPSTIIITATVKDNNGFSNSYQLGPTVITW